MSQQQPRRDNPFRAFGDAVYLSESWTRESPSERQIESFLENLRRFQFYQCYWDGGCCGPEGSMRFLSGADSFLWTAEPYCRKQKVPMKFRAWVRNHRGGDPVARFGRPAVVRNMLHTIAFYKMFDGLHFDYELTDLDDAEGFWKLVEGVSTEQPHFQNSILCRLQWLDTAGFVEALATKVHDLEFPLFGSGLYGSEYVQWCEDTTKLLLTRVPLPNLVLTVPCFPPPDADAPHETLEEAIRGVKQACGLKGARLRLAFYREGLATDEHWQVFAEDWAF